MLKTRNKSHGDLVSEYYVDFSQSCPSVWDPIVMLSEVIDPPEAEPICSQRRPCRAVNPKPGNEHVIENQRYGNDDHRADSHSPSVAADVKTKVPVRGPGKNDLRSNEQRHKTVCRKKR